MKNKMLIVFAVLVIVALFWQPVIAQGGDDAYPIVERTPQYNLATSGGQDDAYPVSTPRIPQYTYEVPVPAPKPMIIIWFRQLVTWVTSIFE